MAPKRPKSENGGGPAASAADILTCMELRDAWVAEHSGDMPLGCSALLGEIATALRMAAKLREAAEEELFVKSERSGRFYAHPGIGLADIEVRRAALLLQRVAAMAKAQPAVEQEPEDDADNPFAELDRYEREAGRRK